MPPKHRGATAASKYGLTKSEIPMPKAEPPPPYPLLETKPDPLDRSHKAQELVIIDRQLISMFKRSADYLEEPEKKTRLQNNERSDKNDKNRQSEKTSLERIFGDIDQNLFPDELLPNKPLRNTARRTKFNRLVNLLDQLEVQESEAMKKPLKKILKQSDVSGDQDEQPDPSTSSKTVKFEDADSVDEEDTDDEEAKALQEEELEDDEDAEEDNDYLNSYFDNGEGFGDDSDDGDDGGMF